MPELEQNGKGRTVRVSLDSQISTTIAAISANTGLPPNYVVNLLLRFAIMQHEEFRTWLATLSSATISQPIKDLTKQSDC